MIGENAWDNGSWIRTPGDVSVKQHLAPGHVIEWHPKDNDEAIREYNEKIRLQVEQRKRRAEEWKAAWRVRILAGPERAVKRYQNAVRKIGLMAVSEALGVG
jgi:hypothetical protein